MPINYIGQNTVISALNNLSMKQDCTNSIHNISYCSLNGSKKISFDHSINLDNDKS